MSIPNRQFQINANTASTTVVAIEELRQSLYNILLTEPGSVPMYPNFGCGLIGLIDSPKSDVAANIRREVVQQVKEYEPRIKIISLVTTAGEGGKLTVEVKWRPSNSDLVEQESIAL